MSEAIDFSRQRLSRIFSTEDELEARMVQELLQTSGIGSVINSEVPHNLFPLNRGKMAKLDILVLESAAEEASRIISEHQASDLEPED